MLTKKTYLSLVIFLFTQILSAQTYQEQCGTVYADSVLKAKYSYLPTKKEFEQWLAPKIDQAQNQRSLSGRFSGPDIYTLPTVVHVVHNGDPVGSNENISAAQVYSQIDILNQDFRRLNPDTVNAPSNFQAVASDVGIEFCLAQVDPNGNILAEPGINRIDAGQATWSSTNDIDNNLKPSTIWDPDLYFNIWVVDFGNNGLLGYAQFPSASGLGGMPGNGGPANTDGIVCLYRAFGNTGNVSAPSNGGRTATHEAGHWLGLRHIWGDGPCGDDDFCNDTPESDDSNRGCPNTSSCGSQDMVQNYMDYTNDACMNIFTEDQVARMRIVMTQSPRRGSLLNSNVCQVLDEYTVSGQVRDATTLNGIANANVKISSTSFNYNTTTDAQGNFSIDVFEGTYDIYAGQWGYVTNVNTGVSVLANTGPVYIDLDEGYYDDFIFDFNWTENSTAATGIWERAVPAATFFNNEASNPGSDVTNDFLNQAYVTGNGGGNAGTDDVDDGSTVLTSPVFDLSAYSEPFIKYYRWFYNAGGSGTPNDSLKVFLSNGNMTVLIDLLDVNSSSSNAWNEKQIQVSNFLPPTANMQITFEASDLNATGHLVEAGLDLFQVVDSIINQNAPPVVNFNASPRTLCNGESVTFTDLSSNQPTSWSWTFQGGSPAASSAQNPSVTYATPGTYEVSLTASNAFGSNTKTETAYITVEGIEADFSADVQNGCPGVSVSFTDQSTCNATSWNWTFPGGSPATSTAQNPVVTYPTAGDYDVSLAVNNGGSSDTRTITNYISIGTGPVNVFFEDFESNSFTTNNWTIDNPDNAIGWDIYTVGGAQTGDKAAGVNFYNYQNAQGEKDGLITSVLNLSNVINTQLTFDHAFRRYSQNEQDSLKVLVSTDGGNTYPNVVFARAEDGTGSLATNTTTTTEFFPAASDDWCFSGGLGATCFTIDLSAFDQTPNVRIKFETVNDYGNNIFLDNIDISGECTASPQGPVADFNSNVTSGCEGLTVNFQDQSLNNPTSYNWTFQGGTPASSTGSNPTVVYNNPGIYAVTLTVSNTDGSDTKTVNSYITVYENPAVLLTGDSPSCFGDTDGTVSANASGGTSPYTFQWSNSATGNIITGVGGGNYSVTVTDDNTCSASGSFNLNEPDQLQITFSINDENCGNGDGSADALVSGGTSPYSYDWSTNVNTTGITNVSAGNYGLTVTDDEGCTASSTAMIQDLPNTLSLVLDIDLISCKDGSDGKLAVNVSGGAAPYTYSWSTNATDTAINNLAAGTYSVTVSDSNNCEIDTSFTLVNPAGFQVSPQLTDAACGNNDGAIALIVSGGAGSYTYDWSNNASGSSISGLSSGNYTVTITDAQSCSEVFSYSINNIGGPTVNDSITNVSCFGAADGALTLQVSGGTPSYTYNWSNSSTASQITALSAGNYTVTVSDQNNCNTIKSYTITAPDSIVINGVVAASGCTVNTGEIALQVSGGTAPYQYTWSNNTSGAVNNNLAAGNYTVTVSDQNNCSAIKQFTVNNLNGPQLQLTAIDADCYNTSTGAASVNPVGSGPFSYEWSNGKTQPINSNLMADTYSVTVTDGNGCITDDTFDIDEPNEIQVSASITDANCGQANGEIVTTVSGGTTPYAYLWSTGQVSNVLSNISAGNYNFTVTDANGCDKQRNYQVNDTGGATLSLNVTQISCYGANDASISVNASGGVAPYFYNWSNGASSQNVSNLAAGPYSVTVTDASNCSTVASSIIREVDSLHNTFIVSDVACGEKFGSATPVVTGGEAPYTLLWSNGTTDSVLITEDGAYGLTITDDKGCTLVDSVEIEETNLTVATQVSADSGQANGTANIIVSGGTPPYTYDWQDSMLVDSSFVSGLPAGTYDLLVIDSVGCTALIDVEIPLNPSIGIEAIKAEMDVQLYPNPSDGHFVLTFKKLNRDINFELYNTIGKQVDAGVIAEGTSTKSFDYELSNGVYFMRIYNEKIEIVEKLILHR